MAIWLLLVAMLMPIAPTLPNTGTAATPPQLYVRAAPAIPPIKARAVLIVDLDANAGIFQTNAHARLAPASRHAGIPISRGGIARVDTADHAGGHGDAPCLLALQPQRLNPDLSRGDRAQDRLDGTRRRLPDRDRNAGRPASDGGGAWIAASVPGSVGLTRLRIRSRLARGNRWYADSSTPRLVAAGAFLRG